MTFFCHQNFITPIYLRISSVVKALGEIVKIVSGLEKKSKSSDCYYQHQILFFNSLTTYHFFYLLLYTPYIFELGSY